MACLDYRALDGSYQRSEVRGQRSEQPACAGFVFRECCEAGVLSRDADAVCHPPTRTNPLARNSRTSTVHLRNAGPEGGLL